MSSPIATSTEPAEPDAKSQVSSLALNELADDSISMSGRQVEALVRVIEAAPTIRRRYQFFVWMQNHLHVLLPHVLAVCGSWQRQRRELVYEVFNSVALPAPTLAALTGTAPPMMGAAARAWVGRQGRALGMATQAGDSSELAELREELATAGLGHFLLHGISRPQRPSELESLFLLAGPDPACPPELMARFELLLPHLHTTYLRVQDTERNLATPTRTHQATSSAEPIAPSQITEREKEILRWVRDGKSNQQIGDVLGISALTVKNHVQKVLRKLGAANRAQAVAIAMSANLLPAGPARP
jgi:transcriptional regulator EpsA